MNRKMVSGVAAVLVLIVAAVLFWLLQPGGSTTEVDRSAADDGEAIAKRTVTKVLTPMEKAEEDWLPLEEDPAIPVVTKTCKWIVTEERRNVPQWVMLDNLRDRGQMFVEDDLRCLTAAGVTPAILDFAERYQDRNRTGG